MAESPEHDARAVWFTAPGRAEILTEQLRSVGPHDVRVRALVSLISAGTEMNVYRGESASAAELNLPTAAGAFPFPVKFAYQIVGTVEVAGSSSGYSEGDLVFAYHPHQDRYVVATTSGGAGDLVEGAPLVFPIPAGLSPDRAAFANLFCVAYNGLLDVPIRIGDVVAVSGLGVIGTLAAYLARMTAGRLIAVDPLAERRARAAWLNADAVVGPEDAVAAVEQASEGRGADVYIEVSGATSALQTAIDATGQEGTIVVLSYYGKRPVALRLSPEFHLRRQRIVSSMVGMIGSGLQPRWNARRRMAVAMEMLGKIDVDALITHRMPFERAPEAYALISERPRDSLGVLLDYETGAVGSP